MLLTETMNNGSLMFEYVSYRFYFKLLFGGVINPAAKDYKMKRTFAYFTDEILSISTYKLKSGFTWYFIAQPANPFLVIISAAHRILE